MARVETLTHYVRQIDRDLYCMKEGDVVLLCRKATVWEDFHVDGSRVLYSRQVPQVVFALTDTFTQMGRPIDLGIEPLVQRIRAIDLQGDFNESKEIVDRLEKDEDIKSKDRSRHFEDMAREVRPMFKKAFSDVNVSSFEKKDKRRLKNGTH